MSEMVGSPTTLEEYRRQNLELRHRLEEAEEMLEAIRSGDVDALLVGGPEGRQVYTLENADRPYRTLIEQMQEGAITLNDQGTILYCNQALAKMLETPSERVIGSSFQQFVEPSEQSLFDHLLGRSGRSELTLHTGTGKTLQTQFSMSELSYPDERIVCAVITDLTLSKQRLQQLAETNHRLQKEILDREATEARLHQAQKMEAVGQLTGGLAHDFNNLLTIILGNLQLIAPRVEDNEKLSRFVRNAISATDRGSKLTQQLLAFSRTQTLKPQAVHVNDLMPGILMLAKQVAGVNIGFETRLSEELWFCQTDPNQLESAILNMVINARDAMPEGGFISLETRNTILDQRASEALLDGYPGQFVQIIITDTGGGIPDEVLARVFEPFFTTKGVGKGSGLGLSMVYGFVRQSSGFIHIESVVGTGTSISLYLPQTEKKQQSGQVQASTPATPDAVHTVLVVEDDPDVRELVKQLIENLGYEVLTANNASDALREIGKGTHVDLVFSDVIMPGMNGIELARTLRTDNPHIPVILTSGFTAQSLMENEQLESEFKILRKPYHQVELAKTLQEALAVKAMGQSIGNKLV